MNRKIYLGVVLIAVIFLMSGFVSAKCPPPAAPFGCIPGDKYPYLGDECHYDYKCVGDKCYERCLICSTVVIGKLTYFQWSSPFLKDVVDHSECCPDLDYYEDWVSYCSGDTVRKHRLFHDFYCSGGTCTDHTSWVDDQLVETCPADYYDCWVYYCSGDTVRLHRPFHDFYCSGGTCTYNTTWVNDQLVENCNDRDSPCCLGNSVASCDYSCVGGSCFLSGILCSEDEECIDGVCKEVTPEFPAGVTIVFAATIFIFLMMRRKYVRK
jgi:phage terminase large subunit-like protein